MLGTGGRRQLVKAGRHRGTPAVEQGLTLAYFSARTEPFLKQKLTLHTPQYALISPSHPLDTSLMQPLCHTKCST